MSVPCPRLQRVLAIEQMPNLQDPVMVVAFTGWVAFQSVLLAQEAYTLSDARDNQGAAVQNAEKLRQALSLNLEACFWLTQAALPHMRRNRFGRILVTSSVSARVAMGGGAHYSAAKAGVNAFIRGAAFELAREGITVNGVEPGFIEKPGRGTLSQPDTMSKIGGYLPIGRMGEADDIAYAMLYLASEQAKYTTGQTIVVDGGSTLSETGFAVERQWGLP